MVAQMTSASLDPATSPPITHATAPRVDGVFFVPSATMAAVENRTGTATTQDLCCGSNGGGGAGFKGNPASDARGTQQPGPQHLRGNLSFQGPPGEYISGGTTVFLPSGTSVSVEERDTGSLELKFATHDEWELDLAAPEGRQFEPGTYTGAVATVRPRRGKIRPRSVLSPK